MKFTKEMIDTFDLTWLENKIPSSRGGIIKKGKTFQEYMGRLVHRVNKERKEHNLPKIKNVYKHIHNYYDGYLQGFLSDIIIKESLFKKELELRQERISWICEKHGIKFTKCGWVYLITNSSFSGWCKIGQTKNFSKRLTSYQTADPFRRFTIAYKVPVNDCLVFETELLNQLKQKYKQNNEWFKLDIKEAIKEITVCGNRLGNQFIGDKSYTVADLAIGLSTPDNLPQ